MTFWAKLLTIIAFVLSLVFATMSGVVFTKRADLRGELKKVGEKLGGQIEALENEKNDANATIVVLQADLTKKTAEATDLANRLDTAVRERETFESEVAKRQALVEKLTTNLSDQQRAFQATLNRNKELIGHNKTLGDKNRQLMSELTGEKTQNSQLRKEKADLENLRDQIKASLAQATQAIALHNEVFAELRSRNIEYRDILDSFLAMPTIRAKVVSVKDDAGMVVLNVGKDDGVKKNFTFTVHRGPKFLAKVSVFEVRDDISAAMIDVKGKSAAIQRGDNAWTRLP